MTFEEYANVFLEESGTPCPSSKISGPCFGQSAYRRMLYAPWENGQTMGNVGVTTNLTPTLLYSCGYQLDFYAPRMQMTSNYTFLFVKPISDFPHVKRYSTDDFSGVDYQPSVDSDYVWDSAVYDDDTIFTLEENWDADGVFRICRVSYSGGTTTREIMCEWDSNPNVGGIDYDYWTNYFFGRVKDGIYDCIVSIWSFLGESPQTYLWKIVIYNINTDTTSEQWVLPSNEFDADLYNLPYGCTSPAFYGSKLIFTYSLIDLHDLPGPPYGSICLFPTLIIDISDNSVTLIDNYKYDLDADYTYTNVYHTTSVVDYATGTYYFVCWVEPDSPPPAGANYIFSMNIDSPSVVLDSSCSTWLECHQGEDIGYAIDEINLPGNNNVVSIPSETVVTNVDTLLANFGRVESLAAIDTPNNMIWNIKSGVLQGKSLNGGADRDITVDWAGATVPFTYPTNREVWIEILDGKCLVMIYSRTTSSPYSYQQDFYLLKE